MLPQPPYSLDLASSVYWRFSDLKRMVHRKRFGSNEEVISETEVYFQIVLQKGNKLLERRWNQRITLQGDYADE